MFFMNNALGRDLGWFWYYWLFTTERVDGSIAQRDDAGQRGPRSTVAAGRADAVAGGAAR